MLVEPVAVAEVVVEVTGLDIGCLEGLAVGLFVGFMGLLVGALEGLALGLLVGLMGLNVGFCVRFKKIREK